MNSILTRRTLFLAMAALAMFVAPLFASAPRTIVIGTGNGYKPYCYLDEQGNLAGYEIEVLKEVNRLLPQYRFELNQLEFKNILLSLEANKVDVGAHQFEKNADREKGHDEHLEVAEIKLIGVVGGQV